MLPLLIIDDRLVVTVNTLDAAGLGSALVPVHVYLTSVRSGTLDCIVNVNPEVVIELIVKVPEDCTWHDGLVVNTSDPKDRTIVSALEDDAFTKLKAEGVVNVPVKRTF